MSEIRRGSQVQDDAVLALLGKKQVLKRRFGFVSLFGFAVCELITWETVLALFYQALNNGGPAGAVYGYIIAWISTISVYTVISELASMAPIAGGQYYWVYMMAPPRWRNILSYVVGWLTTLAWVATVATETLFAGTIIQGILILDYPSYSPGDAEPPMWQGTLLTWAVIFSCIFVNVVIPNWLPRFEIFILVFHLAGFLAIFATILALTPQYGSAASVWLTAINEGGWPTQGLSYCVGFLGNVATFVGADASVHLAEEVSNAALNIPRAILGAMVINGTLGLAMIIAVLYCLGDIDTVIDTDYIFPFIQVFIDSVGNVAGASIMAGIVLALTWACSVGITTTASRMCWSFARDRGLPFWKQLSAVNPKTKIPVVAVLTVTGIAALLTLIYIGSATAFNDVISLTITGFYGSYLFPAAFLLYHRIKGNVHRDAADATDNTPAGAEDYEKKRESPQPSEEAVDPANARVRLVWGPWHVPGLLGTLNNMYACAYMVFVIFWSVWPPGIPVNAVNMNYSVVVTGGVMILSAIWYFIGGKKQYNGPTIDEEVASMMHMEPIVES